MIQVRTARAEDWQAISELFVLAGSKAWATFMTPESLSSFSPPARWLELITEPPPRSQALVAEVDGVVRGFAAVVGEGDTAELDSFYTHPDVWGRGVGRALMASAEALMRQSGYREAILWTESRNERPRAFYENAGWQLDGASRERVVRGSDLLELRYRKLL